MSIDLDYIYALELKAYDTSTSSEIDVFLATETIFFDANDEDAANRTYRGGLEKTVSVERNMMNGALLGGNALPSFGAAVLAVGDEFKATRLKWKSDLRFAGRTARAIRGLQEWTRSQWQTLLEGYSAAEPGYEAVRVTLPLNDFRMRLETPFKNVTYLGTGGFEGGIDLKGQYKPDGVGICRGVEGKWVDRSANLWMDVCASGFHTVYAVRDGGKLLIEDVSNPPEETKYYVDAANGRLRFGSEPTFAYTVDFRSNFAAGSIRAGTIAEEICLRAGYSSGQIDTDAADDIDTARPYDVGWYAPNGESCQFMLDNILLGLLCYYTGTNDAKITFGAINAPTATAKTDAVVALVVTDADIVPGSLKRLQYDAPPRRIDLMWRKNWRVLADSEIAAAADQADKDFARVEYRIDPADNATTATEFPLSKPLPVPTPIDSAAHAATFKVVVKDLLTVPRPAVDVTLAIPPFGLALGAEIWIDSAFDEIDAPAIVVKTGEADGENQVRVTGWALKDAA